MAKWVLPGPFGLGASDHLRGIESTANFIGKRRLATLASANSAVSAALDNHQTASLRYLVIAK